MREGGDVEQWRLDAFQIYLPMSSCLDPFPDKDVAALSKRFFDDPYEAYAALCNETSQWIAFEHAIEALPDRPGDYRLWDASIDMGQAREVLESVMDKSRAGIMRDIRERMEQAARENRIRDEDRGR